MSRNGKRLRFFMVLAALFALVMFGTHQHLNLQQVSLAAVSHNRLATNRLATNRLATNRLATNRLATNRLATNRLATNALSSNRLEANAASADILVTADGRDVYSYLIGCALPEGVTIEAEVPGAPDSNPPETNYTCANGRCAFVGSLGLAADWAEQKLDSKGERWVSACVFARVNFYQTAVTISLRGDHSSLAVTDEEAVAYPLEEGAFYGNLFTHEEDPIDWNACRGRDKAAGAYGALVLRECAAEDPNNPGHTYCGFNYAGDCGVNQAQSPSPYACRTFDPARGGYISCHDTAGEGIWPKSKPYREVITVYVGK